MRSSRRKCPSDPRRNTNGKACNCTQFELVDQMVTDFQEIRIQGHVSKLSMGSMPRSISVILQNIWSILPRLAMMCRSSATFDVGGNQSFVAPVHQN